MSNLDDDDDSTMMTSSQSTKSTTYLATHHHHQTHYNINYHNYPASVREVSTMLLHAQRESFENPRKYSSLCQTNNSTSSDSSLLKCECSKPTKEEKGKEDCSGGGGGSSSLLARSNSIPIRPKDNKHRNIRLSNPDIRFTKLLTDNNKHQPHVCLKPKSPSSTPTIKANVFLNHPEITFPIPVEVSKEDYKNHLIPTHFYPEIKRQQQQQEKKSNNETKQQKEAEKFFKDFGLFGPMGNDLTSNFSHRLHNSNSTEENNHSKIIINNNNNNNNQQQQQQQQKMYQKSEDCEHMKIMLEKLKENFSDLEMKYNASQVELHEMKNLLNVKENDVLKLQREIHKLKSVLEQTTTTIPCQRQQENILTKIQEEYSMASKTNQQSISTTHNNDNNVHHKKQGVSAESTGQPNDFIVVKYEKDFRSKQLIKDALMDNAFLKNLDTSQIRAIVDTMIPKDFPAGSYVLRQGNTGVHLFVSAEGDFEVIQDGRMLGIMGPGKAFGELAILYNCTRTASIRALSDSKVWMLDRKVFQQIMKRTGLQRLQDNINCLKSVPLLENLSNEVLTKIADVLEVEFYPTGEYIIRQGASGDTFYIISSGSVKVTQRPPEQLEEEEIRKLNSGDYFGEQALLKEDYRTASVIALEPGVECLTIDRESFLQLLGSLVEFKEKNYGDEERLSRTTISEPQEFDYIKFEDLEFIRTLGVGGFGRVELVQYTKDSNLTFALKCLKKQHIVETQQQEHVFNERNIMMRCRSPFICRLYKTFKDSKYVYMLLEVCLGGEVWTILRDRGFFDDHSCRFVTACVVEAFDYLHSRGIIYRDLKPENLLVDSQGYVKLVDFGFSKNLGYSNKTWTFCGTPVYVAPETILNKGHDRAIDYWALGVLMHELLTGNPPFTSSDPMKSYNLILKGIDAVDFDNVGRTAQSLIKKLCKVVPSERLGYQRGGIMDIRKHKWFQGFDWDGLVARTLPSPVQQYVRDSCDTSNFDSFPRDSDVPPDEFSNWDANF